MKKMKAGETCEMKGAEWERYSDSARRYVGSGAVRMSRKGDVRCVTAMEDVELVADASVPMPKAPVKAPPPAPKPKVEPKPEPKAEKKPETKPEPAKADPKPEK